MYVHLFLGVLGKLIYGLFTDSHIWCIWMAMYGSTTNAQIAHSKDNTSCIKFNQYIPLQIAVIRSVSFLIANRVTDTVLNNALNCIRITTEGSDKTAC